MKTFDFTKLGGFPLSQDGMAFMQAAYQEPLKALAEMGGTGPHIISGIVETAGVATAGFLFYSGEIIPFVGGAVAATIVVNTYKTILQYGDGNNYEVQTRKEAAFGTGVVQFNYTDLKPFQIGFAERTRTDWVMLEDQPNLDVSYMVDRMAGTITVKGRFTRTGTVGVGDPALMTGPLFTLPAQYAPAEKFWFNTHVDGHNLTLKDMYGTIFKGSNWNIAPDGTCSYLNVRLEGNAGATEHFYFSYYFNS